MACRWHQDSAIQRYGWAVVVAAAAVDGAVALAAAVAARVERALGPMAFGLHHALKACVAIPVKLISLTLVDWTEERWYI